MVNEMNQYDRIAQAYSRGKDYPHPQKDQMLYPSWIEMCGKIKGLRVLDLGCGDGYSSRMLARRGAHVTGVDKSSEMLERARTKEDEEQLGIEYRCIDATKSFLTPDTFDLATPSLLLHYAETEKQLFEVAHNIAQNLCRDGHVVGMNLNPHHPIQKYYDGLLSSTRWIERPLQEGAPVEVKLYTRQGEMYSSFRIHYWSAKKYAEAFSAAGLADPEWIDLQMTSEGKEENQCLWRLFQEHTPLALLVSKKL